MALNKKQTSKNVASSAGELLQKNNLPKKTKSVIASDLAQAPLKSKKK